MLALTAVPHVEGYVHQLSALAAVKHATGLQVRGTCGTPSAEQDVDVVHQQYLPEAFN
jgi:hypothetical protein